MKNRASARFCLHCEACMDDLDQEVCPVCGELLPKADSELVHILRPFEKDGRKGLVDPVTGLVFFPAIHEDILCIAENVVMVKHDGKWSILDHEGNPGFRFDGINDLSSNNAWDRNAPFPVENDDKAGFVTREGKLLIPCVYDYVLPFREGLAEVSVDGKVQFLDENGDKVVSNREKTFEHVRPSFFRCSDGTNRAIAIDSAGLTDLSRTGLSDPHHHRLGSYYPGWRLERNGAYIDLGIDGEEYLCPVDLPWRSEPCRCVEDLQEGRALFTPLAEDDYYGTGIGFLDERGKAVIPPIYSQASRFYNGKALVRSKEDDCYYFIDRDGNKQSDRICEGIIIHYHHPSSEEEGYFWFVDSSTDLRITTDTILDFDPQYAMWLTDFSRHEFIPDIQYIPGDMHRYLDDDMNDCAHDLEHGPYVLEDTSYKTGALTCSGEADALALYDKNGQRVSDASYDEFVEVDGVIAARSATHPVAFFDYQGNRLDVADQVLIDSEEFRMSAGRTLLLDIRRTWLEDYVDEYTGDVIPIKRRAVIANRNAVLSEEDIHEVLSGMHEEYAYLKKEPVRGSDWQLWYRRI